MTVSTKLFKIAEDKNINIHYLKMRSVKSLSVPNNIGINENEIKNCHELNTYLAHELGHCSTNSFYSLKSKFETKERQEHRADRWAIETLIPFDELFKLFQKGITELWELSDYFEVSEELIKKAFLFYESRFIESNYA